MVPAILKFNSGSAPRTSLRALMRDSHACQCSSLRAHWYFMIATFYRRTMTEDIAMLARTMVATVMMVTLP